MLNPTSLLADALGGNLAETYRRIYGDQEPHIAEGLDETARLVIERIANSDALYHDCEHTALVTLCAQDILRGRRIERIVTPSDWGAALVIRQDHVDSGRYRDVSDLKGMNIAIHILGTTPQLYMERVLAKGGLTMDDVQFTIVQIPDQVGALANKAVDAAWAIDPFVTLIEGQGLGKKVVTTGDVFPGAVSMIILLSPVFERQNPEAARRFTVALLRGHRDAHIHTRVQLPLAVPVGAVRARKLAQRHGGRLHHHVVEGRRGVRHFLQPLAQLDCQRHVHVKGEREVGRGGLGLRHAP